MFVTIEIKFNEEGVPEYEENFEEAIKAVNFAVTPSIVPKEVLNILNDDCCINLTSKVMYHSVKF